MKYLIFIFCLCSFSSFAQRIGTTNSLVHIPGKFRVPLDTVDAPNGSVAFLNNIFYGRVNDIWVAFASGGAGVSNFFDLLDVDSTGIRDGYLPYYDAASGHILFQSIGSNTFSGNTFYQFQDSTNTPPVSFPANAVDTLYYCVGGGGTGIFSGNNYKIAMYVNEVFDSFITPALNDWGFVLTGAAKNTWHQYDGVTWPRRNDFSWSTTGNKGGGYFGSTDNSNVSMGFNNTNRIILQGNGTRFTQMSGTNKGIAYFAQTGLIQRREPVASTDTTNNKPVAWAADGTIYRMSYWPGSGGSGSNNANVGSGYRILKPASQELKTLFNGYAVAIDSSINTDGLTFKADTSLLSTRAWRDKLADSLGAIIATKGTLTSVAKGYGIKPDGTITTTGTITVDTNYIQTKLGWYDAVSWGADTTGVTDATTVIQSIMLAAIASGKVDITIYFRYGTYKISGSLLTTDGTNTVNTAQIYIPYSAWSSASKVHIRILGESPPVGYTSRKQTVPVTKGVVFKSTISAAGGGAVFGTAYNTDADNTLGFNFTETTFENIIVTVRSKTGGGTDTIPTITAINADHIAMFNINNCVLNTESPMASSSTPATTARGLVCPGNGNWARVNLNNLVVYNFSTGIVVCEHVNGHNCYVATCTNGVEFTTANHNAYFDRLLLQWNVNHIKITGLSYFKIDYLDIEEYSTANGDPSKWYNSSFDIYEPSTTNSRGSIIWQRSTSGLGTSNGTFTVSATLSPTVKYKLVDQPTIEINANAQPNTTSKFYVVGGDGKVATFPTISSKDVAVFENAGNINLDLVTTTTGTVGIKAFQSAGAGEHGHIKYDMSTNKWTIMAGIAGTSTLTFDANGDIVNTRNYTAGTLFLDKVNTKIGIGSTSPTAYLHITPVSTSAAGTAPIKLTTGSLMTTAEAGAFEYVTPNLYFTNGGGFRQEVMIGKQPHVTTQFDKTSSTTLANITGLTANLASGKTYRFEAKLYTTSANTGGIKCAIAGTATATAIIYDSYVTETGITKTIGTSRATALGTTVCDITAVTAAYVIITGTITVNASGTLTVQFAQNVSDGTASSVLVGSILVTNEIL